MIIREAEYPDLRGLLELYTHLHEKSVPDIDSKVLALWDKILSDKNQHIIVAVEDGIIASSCTVVIVPNLTRSLRPWATVENVVTHADYRCRGFAAACLDFAREIAKNENCYRIMLATGSKDEHVLNFYRRAGYNSDDKTAFIQWL